MAKKGSWELPFFGAGEATYFEWAEVHVLFEHAPSRDEQKRIAKDVPLPLRDSIEFEGAHLMVASDQQAHRAIAAAYARPDDPRDEDDEDDDDADDEDDDGYVAGDEDDDADDERWFFATSAAVSRFNGAIEAWLRDAHRICPILVAYRHEDGESGGTELSAWHRWSIGRIGDLLPALERHLEADEDSGARHAALGILEMAKDARVKLPEHVLDALDPARKIKALVRARDVAGLAALLLAGAPAREALAEVINTQKPEHRALLRKLAPTLLPVLDADESHLGFPLIEAALFCHTDEVDGEERESAQTFLGWLRSRMATQEGLGDAAGYVGARHLAKKRFADALDAFDLALLCERCDDSVYANALYAIMPDNNGMRLDRARMVRYLAAALPHGEQNPPIHHNAACCYVHLGDRDAAFEQLRLLRAHGHDSPETTRDDPFLAVLADDPRWQEIFGDLPAPKKKAKARKRK